MSDQTNCILNEISEDEKFIEIHTSYSESFKKIFDEARSLVSATLTKIKIQQYNKMIKSLLFLINNFEI